MQLSAEDTIAIQNLVASLYLALDEKDPARYADHFLDDATLTHPFGETKGKEAICGWVGHYIAHGNEEGARHYMVNPLAEATAEGARFRCYVIRTRVDVSPPQMATGGLEALCRKGPDGWKVSHKTITIDLMPANA